MPSNHNANTICRNNVVIKNPLVAQREVGSKRANLPVVVAGVILKVIPFLLPKLSGLALVASKTGLTGKPVVVVELVKLLIWLRLIVMLNVNFVISVGTNLKSVFVPALSVIGAIIHLMVVNVMKYARNVNSNIGFVVVGQLGVAGVVVRLMIVSAMGAMIGVKIANFVFADVIFRFKICSWILTIMQMSLQIPRNNGLTLSLWIFHQLLVVLV